MAIKTTNTQLVNMLLEAIEHEYARIERAKVEIEKLREELNDLGWIGPGVEAKIGRAGDGAGGERV